jgi:hypothetical protein
LEERFKDQKVSIAYVYFDYKHQGSQKPAAVTASLLRQLAARNLELNEDLEQAYDELHPRLQGPDLSRLLELLITCARSFTKSFIILDALDECGEEELPDALIRRLCEPDVSFKVFATSRPHPRKVQMLFQPHQTIDLHAHESDLETFLTAKLNENQVTHSELREMILKKLLAKAKGL